ncbi:hypothetical protein AVEN_173871-1 [Araneus ventricosus]|uniref:Uncharacterized protein n=1 Tax=Araneus ventricosus TaxID=182803 RepID=A0A4Y2I0N6_ARAVE|nr:hypothetical protein AVEN_173871-1 [Araneus ventricosus]
MTSHCIEFVLEEDGNIEDRMEFGAETKTIATLNFPFWFINISKRSFLSLKIPQSLNFLNCQPTCGQKVTISPKQPPLTVDDQLPHHLFLITSHRSGLPLHHHLTGQSCEVPVNEGTQLFQRFIIDTFPSIQTVYSTDIATWDHMLEKQVLEVASKRMEKKKASLQLERQ